MEVSSEIQQSLNTRLAQRGFAFAAPDPGLAWIVFQEFVQVPWDGYTTAQIGVDCFNYSDRDNDLYLEFVWDLEQSNDGYALARVSSLLSREVPTELAGVKESLYWSPAQEKECPAWTFARFCTSVEAMPVFQVCLELGGWKLEFYE